MGEPDKGKPADKLVDGATDKQHPFKLTRIFLKVLVRTDFLAREPFILPSPNKQGKTQFHWGGEPVPKLSVVLIKGWEVAAPVLTDATGLAKLDITNLTDGDYDLFIEARTPVTASTTDPAGPALARNLTPPPDRIYRPLKMQITLEGGKLKDAKDPYNPEAGATWARIGNSKQLAISEDLLPLDYRPVFMKSPRERAVRNAADVNMIVCHCTGGWQVGSAINTFKSAPKNSPWDWDAAHYLVDHDGHIIKFCREDHLADHAGITIVWGNLRSVNPVSIGIEIVHHSKDGDHPEAEVAYNPLQIKAVIGLLGRLQADTTMRIAKHRIVGHSDVDFVRNYEKDKVTGVMKPSSLGSRDTDPGQKFPWEQVEAAGLGMIPQAEPAMTTAYGGFFSQVAGGSLTRGDDDSKKVWGGKPRKPWDEKAGTGMPVPNSSPPIKELQDDLGKIGYTAVGMNNSSGGDVSDAAGVYGEHTAFQVKKFQWHFFSFNRTRKADGVVDLETAKMIKRVKAGIPTTP